MNIFCPEFFLPNHDLVNHDLVIIIHFFRQKSKRLFFVLQKLHFKVQFYVFRLRSRNKPYKGSLAALRRGRDKTTISLRSFVPPPLSLKREGWTARSLRSHAALRVLAFGQNLRRLRFTSFRRRLSNPLRGFGVSLMKKIWSPQGAPYFFRRERDSNPRTCDSLRISRPAQSTTLASLRGSHNVEKKHPFVYPPNKNPLIPFFYFYIWPQIQ